MLNWRPKEGWKNPHRELIGGRFYGEARVYEAGADALAEAMIDWLEQRMEKLHIGTYGVHYPNYCDICAILRELKGEA